MSKRPGQSKLPRLTTPAGFRAAGITCGIKSSRRRDLALIVADDTCAAAGLFTRNNFKGAPVIIAQRHLRNGKARAIVCNSGVSNVATGKKGLENAGAMCKAAADAIGCDPHDVLPCSTGVIGRPLPMHRIIPGIAKAAKQLKANNAASAAAAKAILTTDLVPKHAGATCTMGRRRITIGGIAKGSGMIAPNLATMLAFLTTDAVISSTPLKTALRRAVAVSFNRISIDTDTSTSDAVLILANGQAGNPRPTKTDIARFTDALTDVCRDLAYQLVRDGEGATKVFRVNISGARSEREADRVGRAVAESPLVKTAVHGGDPNWGRLVMAIGKSGAAIDPQRVSIRIGTLTVFSRGRPTPTGLNPPRRLQQAMERREIDIAIDLGRGRAAAEWLGCDLSRDYIRINADYTT